MTKDELIIKLLDDKKEITLRDALNTILDKSVNRADITFGTMAILELFGADEVIYKIDDEEGDNKSNEFMNDLLQEAYKENPKNPKNKDYSKYVA